MSTEIGEFAVGAYLRLCEKCDVIDFNARSSSTGLSGMTEIDVIGLRFCDSTAFLCEVATHLEGLNYGSYKKTISRIKGKFQRQKEFATANLSSFSSHKFMFWSPRVPNGALTVFLDGLEGLELIINRKYAMRMKELQLLANSSTKEIGNPFFRALQIMGHLRKTSTADPSLQSDPTATD